MPADNDAFAEILQRLTRIEAMIATEGARCPHREDIARAMNSIQERKALAARVDRVEEKQNQRFERIESNLVETQISLARMLATGGAGGAIVTVLFEVVKRILEQLP